MLTHSTFLILPLACSLTDNELGEDVVWTLGYDFKKTKITNLGCATAMSDRDLVCQRPLTLLRLLCLQARSQRPLW